MKSPAPFRATRFPRDRQNVIDALEVGRHRHVVHALLEFDVTKARQLVRDHKVRTGETLSFTAFVVACTARAIEANKLLHAYRDWRGRLILFDDVDAVTIVESEIDRVAIPHIIRAANRKTPREIHDEIRRVQATPATSEQRSSWLMKLSPFAPGFVRRTFFRTLQKKPQWLKHTSGTTLVSAVGMFGTGSGWGIGLVPLHTLALTIGGITQKPAAVNGRIEIREHLHLTLSIDHDIVDGAPAARFVAALRELIEGAYGVEVSLRGGASES